MRLGRTGRSGGKGENCGWDVVYERRKNSIYNI